MPFIFLNNVTLSMSTCEIIMLEVCYPSTRYYCIVCDIMYLVCSGYKDARYIPFEAVLVVWSDGDGHDLNNL